MAPGYVIDFRVGWSFGEPQDCRVSDGSRVMGADVVALEVLFQGRFSDLGLPASPRD